MNTSIRDQITNVNPVAATQASVGVVDHLSDHRPAVQVQSLAVLYYLICQHFGLDYREEMARAQRLVLNADGKYRPEVSALKGYIEGELN